MQKLLHYTFLNKVCHRCNRDAVEDFWIDTDNDTLVKRSGCYCPQCNAQFDFKVTSDPSFIENARYILHSKEKTIIRKVSDIELIKKHGVYAEWLYIGKKLYSEPEKFYNTEVNDFVKAIGSTNKILVYMPNSHLQRLYFFIPKDALG